MNREEMLTPDQQLAVAALQKAFFKDKDAIQKSRDAAEQFYQHADRLREQALMKNEEAVAAFTAVDHTDYTAALNALGGSITLLNEIIRDLHMAAIESGSAYRHLRLLTGIIFDD